MSELVHARVVDHLSRLRLGHVAERLDAMLAAAARAEPTYLDFLAEEAIEEVEIGRLRTRRRGEHRVEPLRNVPEMEAREMIDDARVNELAHEKPPATTAA